MGKVFFSLFASRLLVTPLAPAHCPPPRTPAKKGKASQPIPLRCVAPSWREHSLHLQLLRETNFVLMATHHLTVLTLEPWLPSAPLTCQSHLRISRHGCDAKKPTTGLPAWGRCPCRWSRIHWGESRSGGQGAPRMFPRLSQLPPAHHPAHPRTPLNRAACVQARCIHGPGPAPSLDGCCFLWAHNSGGTWAAGRAGERFTVFMKETKRGALTHELKPGRALWIHDTCTHCGPWTGGFWGGKEMGLWTLSFFLCRWWKRPALNRALPLTLSSPASAVSPAREAPLRLDTDKKDPV